MFDKTFPRTGNPAADKWVSDARGYCQTIANRCRVCLAHRCRECYSLQARMLVQRHEALCRGMTWEDELEKDKQAVVAQIRKNGRMRGDSVNVPGLRGPAKTKFLAALCAEGRLQLERKITGESGHYSLYYSIPPTNTQQQKNG